MSRTPTPQMTTKAIPPTTTSETGLDTPSSVSETMIGKIGLIVGIVIAVMISLISLSLAVVVIIIHSRKKSENVSTKDSAISNINYGANIKGI